MAKTVTSEKIETPKFRAQFLLDPSNAEHAAAIKRIKSEAKRIAELTFEGKIPNSLELCFGNGNDLDKVYDGYADMFYLKANNENRVPVVGRRKGTNDRFVLVQKGDPEWPLAGDYVNVSITLWCQHSHGRKGINGNLLAIQFIKTGERFGHPDADPDDEFEALEDGGTEGSDDSCMFD